MRLAITSLILLLAAPALAPAAQEFDLGSDISGYRRFLVYPHLRKGREAMQRGDRDRALAELERARVLAPENAVVALHLAEAYRTFGELARAESVLRDQLARTPHEARVRAALTELRLAAQPPAASPCDEGAGPSAVGATCHGPVEAGGASSAMSSQAGPAPVAARPVTGRPAARPPATAAPRERGPGPNAVQTKPPFEGAEREALADLRAHFTLALQAGRVDDAQRQASVLLGQEVGRAALLDELSYQLVQAGATEQATRVLLQAYPFDAGTPAERDGLLQRLILLIERQQGTLEDGELALLRDPLDTPALRSRQAVLWTALQDCSAVRALLGDMSPEYGHDDWMRLGECAAAEASALAQEAYARAHHLQPGGPGSRALGYQAHAAADYRTALGAWRSVGPERLSDDGLLGAVTTALAAGEREQAGAWLDSYRERGGPQGYRYWSLMAQRQAGHDAAAAAAALERAIDWHADVDDYLRLARWHSDPGRQVHWLESAADLDAGNVGVQLELAYAYQRAGRPARARRALERAAELDPGDLNVQLELGYAYWRDGRAAHAQGALERVWRADPANLAAAQQLVYVHQRLGHNEAARWYARQVLDGLPLAGEAATTELADRRFGLQRLHEDLGRRVSISLDGWSGTRVGTGTSAAHAGSRYRSYSQFEAEYRLGDPPIRDGTTLAAYARILADGGDGLSALPSENPMLGLGVRWKPWRGQVIYLAAEHQHALEGHRPRDLLLRASASFLNGGRYGDDWHPSGKGWFAQNLYLDTAHYLNNRYSAFTADYRPSYHGKVAASQTVEPYGHVQINGTRNGRLERDIRSGFGLRWNIWHGATRYNAHPHRVTLGLEFQQAFKTDLADRNGLFLTLGARW